MSTKFAHNSWNHLNHTCADDSEVIPLIFVTAVSTESRLTDSPFADSIFVDDRFFLYDTDIAVYLKIQGKSLCSLVKLLFSYLRLSCFVTFGFHTKVMKTTNPCIQLKIEAMNRMTESTCMNDKISTIHGTPMTIDRRM